MCYTLAEVLLAAFSGFVIGGGIVGLIVYYLARGGEG